MQIDIKDIVKIAQEAGVAILRVYNSDNFDVTIKGDNSPLTLADKEGNAIIVESLKKMYPDIPIISEENKLTEYEIRKTWTKCWLVDPLDGTKEFIKRNGEFTVNIALIDNGTPVLGVVHVPAKNQTYYAEKDNGSFLIENSTTQKLSIKTLKPGELAIVGSRSHGSPEMDEYVDKMKSKYQQVDFVAAGSSLKFCLVAEGKADVYPRLAPTMEWDTGAGHIVATEAGAEVLIYGTNQPLQYNKENLLNPHFIVKNPALN